MLALLNLYCHGYVATPIIETCNQHGLFTLLDKNKVSARKVQKFCNGPTKINSSAELLERKGQIDLTPQE